MRIPSDVEFGSDFLKSDDIQEVGERIIREKLTALDDGEIIIDYAWKQKGGRSSGNAVLGKCVKLSGPARYYALGSHFLVWLAADHGRSHDFNDRQLEALIYHELCHIDRIEPEDADKPVTYKTRGHDFEGFLPELEQYGAWEETFQAMERVVRQLPLPGLEPVLTT